MHKRDVPALGLSLSLSCIVRKSERSDLARASFSLADVGFLTQHDDESVMILVWVHIYPLTLPLYLALVLVFFIVFFIFYFSLYLYFFLFLFSHRLTLHHQHFGKLFSLYCTQTHTPMYMGILYMYIF